MRRTSAMVIGVAVLTTALTGCSLGDYLAYEPCERYSEQLAAVIEATVGERPDVGDIWADGAGNPLCHLTFSLEQELTSGDPERSAMGDAIDELRAEWPDEVRLTVTSSNGESFSFG
jgi:hypothetical protein